MPYASLMLPADLDYSREGCGVCWCPGRLRRSFYCLPHCLNRQHITCAVPGVLLLVVHLHLKQGQQGGGGRGRGGGGICRHSPCN